MTDLIIAEMFKQDLIAAFVITLVLVLAVYAIRAWS
jgi:hypothetical protein